MQRERPVATEAEAKALANPLRLRILRLCLDTPRTNKQLADHLGRDPASVLHHVRTLVRTGFLEAGEPRAGAGGALEKPYVTTRKSWTLDTGPTVESQAVNMAIVHAFRDEVLEAGPDAFLDLTRLGLRLTPSSQEDLRQRLFAVIDEFAQRPPDDDGEPVALFLAVHRRP